jgi:hypothetical protein
MIAPHRQGPCGPTEGVNQNLKFQNTLFLFSEEFIFQFPVHPSYKGTHIDMA